MCAEELTVIARKHAFHSHAKTQQLCVKTIMLFSVLLVLGASILGHCDSLPRKHTFSSQTQEDVSLRFVNNSGICETTPGVHQMSGYVDIGTNMSIVCCPRSSSSSPQSHVPVVLVFCFTNVTGNCAVHSLVGGPCFRLGMLHDDGVKLQD